MFAPSDLVERVAIFDYGGRFQLKAQVIMVENGPLGSVEKKRKIVLVLGAGASKDYGFPLGAELKHAVVTKLESGGQQRNKRTAGQRLRLLNSDSLDDFAREVDFDEQPVLLVKEAIAEILIQCETHAIERQTITPPTDDWIIQLARKVWVEKVHDLEKITIVTFNYDRLFEWRMYFWLAARTEFQGKNADAIWTEFYSKFEIHHVYGRLPYLNEGECAVSDTPSNTNSCPFGLFQEGGLIGHGSVFASETNHRLMSFVRHKAKGEFLTIYESALEKKQSFAANREKFRRILMSADKVVMIGFGFNEQNMKILGFPFRCDIDEEGCSTSKLRIIALAYPGHRADLENLATKFVSKEEYVGIGFVEETIVRYDRSIGILS